MLTAFFAVAHAGLGQSDTVAAPMVVQLTGVVVEGDSLGPVPFATVYRARDQRGTITDEYGFFCHPGARGRHDSLQRHWPQHRYPRGP